MPIDNAHEVLTDLSSGYDLTLLTSRSKDGYEMSVEWIEQNFSGIFDRINLSGIWDEDKSYHLAHMGTKAEKFFEIGADYLIDDQLKHCISVADNGGKAILFGDYPWNQGKLPKGVTRCKNWHEVRLYFEKV